MRRTSRFPVRARSFAIVLLALVAATWASPVLAQLQGGSVYPIDGVENPPVSFQSIGTAVAYMVANGVTGSGQVVLELSSGYAGEAGPVTIPPITGTSATLGVTFRPTSGYSAQTITAGAASPNQFAIKITGSYIMLDGQAGGGGGGRDWLIRCTGSGSSGYGQSAVRVDNTNNSMTDVTVRYCVLEAEAANTTSAIFGFAGGSTYTLVNLVIDHNLIRSTGLASPSIRGYGISLANTSNSGNTGCVVSNNEICDTYSNFIRITNGAFPGLQIRGNELYHSAAITMPSASSFAAIYFNTGTCPGTAIRDNFIHDIRLANGSSSVDGIYVWDASPTGAPLWIYNNRVAFGAEIQPANVDVWGIRDYPYANELVTVEYNSVYIGGSPASGTYNSGAYKRQVSTIGNCRNNIFFNARSNSGTASGKHWAIWINGTTGYVTLGFNDYYATGTGGYVGTHDGGTTSHTTLASWQAAVPLDQMSISQDPHYLSPTGTPPDLHVDTTIGSTLESAGQVVSGIDNDCDGDIRYGSPGYAGTGSAPDIGADEFEGILVDLTPPAIAYTPIPSNTATTTYDFDDVAVTDASGVDGASGTRPRVYYKRSVDANAWNDNTSATDGWKYAEANGATSPFDFTLDYSLVNGGVVQVGDVIQYFVVAQDLASPPNVGINSGTFAAQPASVALTAASFPIGGTIRSYAIVDVPLSGDYTVGTALFNRVTGADLTFERRVQRVLREVLEPADPVPQMSGDKAAADVFLADQIAWQRTWREVEEATWVPISRGRTYEEPLSVQRSEHPDLPAEAQRGVYATITAAVADLNARGVSGPVRFLLTDATYPSETFPVTVQVLNENMPTATNTVTIKPATGVTATVSGASASSALFKIINTNYVAIDGSNAAGGTTRDLTLENTSATSPVVVWFGSLGTTPITNGALAHCVIRNGANTSSAVVISDGATVGGAGRFSAMEVRNNQIEKAYIGVYATGGSTPPNGFGLTYADNQLDASGAAAIRLAGLYMQGVDGATVSGNTIGNFDPASGENDIGIWLASGTINATVSGNSVSNLGYTGTSSYAPIGISVTSAVAGAHVDVSGNVVTGMSTTGTTAVRGIASTSTGTTDVVIQRNSVQGVTNGSASTYGAYGIDVTGGSHTIRNNFVSDVRFNMTGGYAFSTTYGVFGIRVGSGTGHVVAYNSVNLFGAMLGTANSNLLSAALAVVGTASTGCDMRDNLLANTLTGGTTSIAHVSAYLPSGGTSAMNLTWNNNAYYSGTSAASQGIAQVGTTAGTGFYLAGDFDPDATTPAANLRAYTSTLSATGTNDDASLASTEAAPYETDTDLHVDVSGIAVPPVANAGAAIGGITDDYDGDLRSATPDIGADEFTSYTLVVSVEGGGSVAADPDQPLYNPGTSVELAAAGNPGWKFLEWSGDATGSDNPLAVVMDADKSITAHFGYSAEISIADAAADEGDSGTSAMLFAVTLSEAPADTVKVDFATADSTALAGEDYTALSGQLVFAPGDSVETIAVDLLGDLLNEEDEYFKVLLSNPVFALLADDSAVGTIENDDPLPGFSVSDESVLEGDRTLLLFTVTLSAASAREVGVTVHTEDGTAIAGEDYEAVPPTELTFLPGEPLEQTVAVTVLPDTLVEPDETFLLVLTDPVLAELVDAQGVGTIEDDDATLGACCFEDGSCALTLETECIATGGVFSGTGTTCEPNLCPQPVPKENLTLASFDDFERSFPADYQGWILQLVERWLEPAGPALVLDYLPFAPEQWADATQYPYLPGSDAAGNGQGAFQLGLHLEGEDDAVTGHQWFDAVLVQSEDVYTHTQAGWPAGYEQHADYTGSWPFGHYNTIGAVTGDALRLRVYSSGFHHENDPIEGRMFTRSGLASTYVETAVSGIEHGWNILSFPVNEIDNANNLRELGVKLGSSHFVWNDLFVDEVTLGDTPYPNRYVFVTPDIAYFSETPDYDTKTVSIYYDDGGGASPSVRGFSLELHYPAGCAAVAGVTEGEFLLPPGEPLFFEYEDDGAGTLTIDWLILGVTQGVNGPGKLATVTFTAADPLLDCCDALTFNESECRFRDPNNVPITNMVYVGGEVSHDITPPIAAVLGSPTHTAGVASNADDLKVTWATTQDPDLGLYHCPVGMRGYYLALDQNPSGSPDPQGTYAWFTPWSPDSTGYATWFTDLAEGTWYVHIIAYDWLWNASTVGHFGPITIDTTAPGMVTGFDADVTDEADRSVDLMWVNPGDGDLVGVEVYRMGTAGALGSTYPEYDDDPNWAVPAWPATQAAAVAAGWTLVGQFPGTNHVDLPVARDYYYYIAFAYDGAGNYGGADAGSRDATLSYWLGDFNGTANPTYFVDIHDVLVISLAYNTEEGEPAYNPICDIGPTVDWGRKSLPTTDNEVEFEDVIVLALNYENAQSALMASPSEECAGRMTARLEQGLSNDLLEVRVMLAENPGCLKGASVELTYGSGLEYLGASQGEIWSGVETFFFDSREDGALLLDACGLSGPAVEDGCHAVARFRVTNAGGNLSVRLTDFRARGYGNVDLAGGGYASDVEDLPLPVAHGLMTARPNPTMRSATIPYSLAREERVELRIYDAAGRLVRELFDGTQAAGYYRIDWDGLCVDGSAAGPGIYFYRMRAGDYESSRRLTLVR